MAATATKPKTRSLKGATVALVLLTAMNFVNYLDRYILPAVQEQVKGEFQLTDNQIGSLTFWFIVAYVLSSPLTGWLGDRFPRKPMIVVAALAIAAMNFFTASVHSYMSLNLRHAALGIGEASFGIFAPALLADFYAEDQRNGVLTVFNVAMPVGAALGYCGRAWVAAHHGWRMAFIASAVPGAVIALLILFFMREPERAEAKDKKESGEGLRDVAAEEQGVSGVDSGICGGDVFAGRDFVVDAVVPASRGGLLDGGGGGVMGPIIVVAGWVGRCWADGWRSGGRSGRQGAVLGAGAERAAGGASGAGVLSLGRGR